MRILCPAIFSLLALSAQPFPDGAELLARSGNALKAYSSFEYTEVMSGGPAGMVTTMLYQGTNSGKMRVTQKIQDMDGILIVSDGRETWMYVAMMKRYTKMPPDSKLLSDVLTDGPAGDDKVVRSETIEVDGEPHDCWVVESRTPKVSHSGVATHWIDKISSIEFKLTVSSSFQAAGSKEPVETTTTITRHGYKFNPAFDDALFVFTPPAGATETDELFPGMKPGTPKTEPAPLATEAQAFVPNLTPTTRVEAARPGPIDDDVRPEVRLLVTIDPTGSVVKAEALAGPEPLRKSAIDAVMQWKFHPVIRNGAPVYAYTDTTINFTDFSKPVKPVQMDMSGTMDALGRIQALEERFPRTPQQELADLENDLEGVTGPARSFALPRLAKAALKADAIEKAADYANELLRSPSDDPNYGQAVHDGNLVLGMIALKQGDVGEARRHLLESAKVKGSPVLSSFGPNMLLAKALLERGEREAVLQYFESCRAFWSTGAAQLDAWSATVRSGGMPSFGANLVY